jgi:hypothetical protein
MMTVMVAAIFATALLLARLAFLVFIYRVARDPRMNAAQRNFIADVFSKVTNSAVVAIANAITASFNYLRRKTGDSEDPPS